MGYKTSHPEMPRTPDEAMMDALLRDMATRYPDLKDELYRSVAMEVKEEFERDRNRD